MSQTLCCEQKLSTSTANERKSRCSKKVLISNSNSSSDFEWGVISICSCGKSCYDRTTQNHARNDDTANNNLGNDSGTYIEEHSWAEPPPPVIDELASFFSCFNCPFFSDI